LKSEDSVSRLSLVLDARKHTEQHEEAWRTSDDQAWKRLTGGTPEQVIGEVPVASPQDVALREGAAIVADMHELQQHG